MSRFEVGDRVISRAYGMKLRGTVAALRRDLDGKEMLDITRDSWPGRVTDECHPLFVMLTDWYRYPEECERLP